MDISVLRILCHPQHLPLPGIFLQAFVFHPQAVNLHLQVHIFLSEIFQFFPKPGVFFLQIPQMFFQHQDLLFHCLIENYLLWFYKLSSLLQIPGPFYCLIHFLIIIKKGSGKSGPFHQVRNRYQFLILQHSVDFPKSPAYLFPTGSPVNLYHFFCFQLHHPCISWASTSSMDSLAVLVSSAIA